MQIKPSVHNAIIIGGMAIMVILLFKLAAQTRLGRIPVLGDAIKLGASV